MRFLIEFIRFVCFGGYKPNPLDPRYPLAQRFAGKAIAVVNIGPFGFKLAEVRYTKDGPIIEKVIFLAGDGEAPITPQVINLIKERSPSRFVAVGCSLKAKINVTACSDQDIAAVKDGFNGDMRDKNACVQILPDMTSKKMIRASVDKTILAKIESALENEDLNLADFSITPVTMFNTLLGQDTFDCVPRSTAPVSLDGSVSNREASNKIALVVDQGWVLVSNPSAEKGALNQGRSPLMMLNSPNANEALHDIFSAIHERAETTNILEPTIMTSGYPAEMVDRMRKACDGLKPGISFKNVLKEINPDIMALAMR